MSKPRLLIADDHQMFAEGLKRLLGADFEVAGVVRDGRELVTAAEKLRPDVIVADISMPMLNGIEAVRQIKKTHPGIKVVFLTMHPDVAYAVSAFKAGASGYVLKHSAPDELHHGHPGSAAGPNLRDSVDRREAPARLRKPARTPIPTPPRPFRRASEKCCSCWRRGVR